MPATSPLPVLPPVLHGGLEDTTTGNITQVSEETRCQVRATVGQHARQNLSWWWCIHVHGHVPIPPSAPQPHFQEHRTWHLWYQRSGFSSQCSWAAHRLDTWSALLWCQGALQTSGSSDTDHILAQVSQSTTWTWQPLQDRPLHWGQCSLEHCDQPISCREAHRSMLSNQSLFKVWVLEQGGILRWREDSKANRSNQASTVSVHHAATVLGLCYEEATWNKWGILWWFSHLRWRHFWFKPA